MSSPRAGGPSRRRSFTPAQKLQHLDDYAAACVKSQGGAYLRREGLYSSLISEWRRLRDAGLLEGKEPGAKVGRPNAEQAEIARLRRELAESERQLATTEIALDIMGKAHALLEPGRAGAARRARVLFALIAKPAGTCRWARPAALTPTHERSRAPSVVIAVAARSE